MAWAQEALELLSLPCSLRPPSVPGASLWAQGAQALQTLAQGAVGEAPAPCGPLLWEAQCWWQQGEGEAPQMAMAMACPVGEGQGACPWASLPTAPSLRLLQLGAAPLLQARPVAAMGPTAWAPLEQGLMGEQALPGLLSCPPPLALAGEAQEALTAAWWPRLQPPSAGSAACPPLTARLGTGAEAGAGEEAGGGAEEAARAAATEACLEEAAPPLLRLQLQL